MLPGEERASPTPPIYLPIEAGRTNTRRVVWAPQPVKRTQKPLLIWATDVGMSGHTSNTMVRVVLLLWLSHVTRSQSDPNKNLEDVCSTSHMHPLNPGTIVKKTYQVRYARKKCVFTCFYSQYLVLCTMVPRKSPHTRLVLQLGGGCFSSVVSANESHSTYVPYVFLLSPPAICTSVGY